MTTADAPSSRVYLDVSKLPASAMDYRSPLWWGNALVDWYLTTFING